MKQFVLLGFSCVLWGVRASTVTIPLKTHWRFIKQDDPALSTNFTYHQVATILDRAFCGDLSRAPQLAWAAPAFDDAAWQCVRVPHDWGVEKSFDTSLYYGDAFLPVTGVGWYRRTFTVTPPEKGTVYFECDGAMSFSMVWVNGRFVGGWPYGYTRFRLDITPYLVKGSNTLAVRCDNPVNSSRWYSGGGLYRNCRLLVCPADHVLPGSVAITTPEVTSSYAKVRVAYRMSRSGARTRTFTIDHPHLWDIDDPYLYTVDVEGNPYRYGIRTIQFHADTRRFQLNGRTVPLNGVCMHHDFGVLGAAWNRAAQKRRLLLFKEAGVNAIRSSHNPPDEGLLELCDELGLLVKDEVFDVWRTYGKDGKGDAGKRPNGYNQLFDVWHERDVRAWVQTDRNHPCVILYSLGNEIPDGKPYLVSTSEYAKLMRNLARIVTSEDSTRPTTVANNCTVNYTNNIPALLPVMGCNYFSWMYPELVKRYPDVPFFGTETICMGSTRGVYQFPVHKRGMKADEATDFYCSSYCWSGADWDGELAHGWGTIPDAQWYWMDLVGTCMGEFVWTGIDYLGGPYWAEELRRKPHFSNPADQARALDEVKRFGRTMFRALHTCNCGFLDLSGFKKDSFWLFQSRWLPNKPMAHLLPHWTWPDRVGQLTPVYVFTSGDSAELFLNGRSLGRQKREPRLWNKAYRLCWDHVRYEPGTLEVVAYRNGREWARDTVRTAHEPSTIRLSAECPSVLADGEDACWVTAALLDASGTVVPRLRTRVSFTLEGPGAIVATDNGDEAACDDFHAPVTTFFNGLAQVIVRPHEGAKGTLRLSAHVENLPVSSCEITVR